MPDSAAQLQLLCHQVAGALAGARSEQDGQQRRDGERQCPRQNTGGSKSVQFFGLEKNLFATRQIPLKETIISHHKRRADDEILDKFTIPGRDRFTAQGEILSPEKQNQISQQ